MSTRIAPRSDTSASHSSRTTGTAASRDVHLGPQSPMIRTRRNGSESRDRGIFATSKSRSQSTSRQPRVRMPMRPPRGMPMALSLQMGHRSHQLPSHLGYLLRTRRFRRAIQGLADSVIIPFRGSMRTVETIAIRWRKAIESRRIAYSGCCSRRPGTGKRPG